MAQPWEHNQVLLQCGGINELIRSYRGAVILNYVEITRPDAVLILQVLKLDDLTRSSRK